MPPLFAIAPAQPEEQPLLERLVQLYLYDISVCGETDLDPVGLFTGLHLRTYWTPDHAAFVIRCGLSPVGFALVSNQSRLVMPFNGHCCDALFITRRHRRQGLGQAAAHTMFTQFPGAWEITSSANNLPAQSFWRAVVDRFTKGHYAERWLQTSEFRGSVQSFVVASNQVHANAVSANGFHPT